MVKKYTVKFYASAYRDVDAIYEYIAQALLEPKVAQNLIETLENTILDLEEFPERGANRQIGLFANKGYRQLFVKNYTIVYRVYKDIAEVHIVTVRYAPSQF